MVGNRFILRGRFAACVLFLSVIAFSQLHSTCYSQDVIASKNPVEYGRQLFEHEWTLNDPLSPNGDGLGPLYNAKSCLACHDNEKHGGASGNKHNVDILVLKTPLITNSKKAALESKWREKIHPTLILSKSFMVHKLSTHADYYYWQKTIFGKADTPFLMTGFGSKKKSKMKVVHRTINNKKLVNIGPLPFQHVQRNSPSLLGIGEIDLISDKAIRELESKQAIGSTSITGIVSTIPTATTIVQFTANGAVNTRVTKFGWRGQTGTLREFVMLACANEMGLQSTHALQNTSPVKPKYQLHGADINERQMDALVAYIRSLDPPEELSPSGTKEAKSWERGAKLFTSANCAVCHVPNVDNAKGVYSDFLLHDMGKELSDPSTRNSSSYCTITDGRIKVPEAEWRTPPLWGIRNTAPYMHDGRSATLRDAILAHGGEAKQSVEEFKSADKQLQNNLIAYVRSLGAPPKGKPGKKLIVKNR